MIKKISLTLFFNISLLLSEETSMQDSLIHEKKGAFITGIFYGGEILSLDTKYLKNSSILHHISHAKIALGFSYGLKFGYDFFILPKQGIKLYADYSNAIAFKNLTSGKTKTHHINFNADYYFNLHPIMGLFFGVSIGSILLDAQYLKLQNALNGGVNLGMLFYLPLNFEIELKMRFLSNTLKSQSIPIDSMEARADQQNLKFGDFINATLGLNYKF